MPSAIARALAMSPKVLLCDEITSALDPELVNEVLSVVRQLAKDGMTLIMVTHEMRFAREVGDKLVFMHQCKVQEVIPPQALFANPRTPELANFIGSVGQPGCPAQRCPAPPAASHCVPAGHRKAGRYRHRPGPSGAGQAPFGLPHVPPGPGPVTTAR